MTLMKNYYLCSKTLRELVDKYKQRKLSFDKQFMVFGFNEQPREMIISSEEAEN